MQIKPFYDRTKLINVTTDTVKHIILTGLALVTAGAGGDDWGFPHDPVGGADDSFRRSVCADANGDDGSLCQFDFDWRDRFRNSGGCIDRGAGKRVSKISRRIEVEDTANLIVEGVTQSAKPVIYATIIILISFIPLFTMQGVPGKIFAPMSMTYGFALIGALIYALFSRRCWDS